MLSPRRDSTRCALPSLTQMAGEAARSTTYTVWLDTAAPETQAQFDMQTGTLTVTATDAASGVDGISLDGGQDVAADDDGGRHIHLHHRAHAASGGGRPHSARCGGQPLAEHGGLRHAGGMGGSFGGGSFSGGSSGTTRTVSHSSGSEEEATPYGGGDAGSRGHGHVHTHGGAA